MLAELSRREKEANIKPDPDLGIYMKAAATEGQEAKVYTDYVLRIWAIRNRIFLKRALLRIDLSLVRDLGSSYQPHH
ncbi:pleiotropic drug resistance protein 1-like [Nicotiana tabacum]|uniref:Pleiotropic drug resistance protein 1-like n=2 Tax=Nicotiana TaxID=4085 RepID=A0AC58SA72_TOBAC